MPSWAVTPLMPRRPPWPQDPERLSCSVHGHGGVHPDGYGQAEDDDDDAQDHRGPAEYQARQRQAHPCSPVCWIWLWAMWTHTIAGMVASGPDANCASPQARLAIASPLILAAGVTTVVLAAGVTAVAGATGRSVTTWSRSA